MLQIAFIRENQEKVINALAKRNIEEEYLNKNITAIQYNYLNLPKYQTNTKRHE